MAQSTHALLLAESNSIEYVPRLSPPAPINTSNSSTSSVDSGSNVISQGEASEGANKTSLPSFYPSGLRNAAPSSNPDQSPRDWVHTLFRGWRVVLLSWLNILLLLIPLSWAMTLSMQNTHSLTFVFCILALIPLVRLHELSTRELSIRIGGAKTGLMNASMSNFVTIVIAMSALRKCELRVAQSALIGSMLSKLLLVLGLCFLAGGMRFSEQGFDATATQIHSSLLSLSVGAVLLPAAYHFALSDAGDASAEIQMQNILHMSHGVSIVLLLIYVAYLLFQLWSHSHLYDDQHDKKSTRLTSVIKEKNANRKERRISMARTESIQSDFSKAPDERPKERTFSFDRTESQPDFAKMVSDPSSTLYPPRRPFATPSPLSSSSELTLSIPTDAPAEKGVYFQTRPGTPRLATGTSVPMVRDSSRSRPSSVYSNAESTVSLSLSEKPDHDRSPVVESPSLPTKKEPQLSWTLTVLLLVLVTAFIALTVDRLVESMDAVSSTISKDWVGLILLPGISSVAECLGAVRVSVKDELTLSVSVAVGSTIQTALFVIPLMVILAWITHKPLSLLMDPFQSMVLYIAVQTMNYVVADGKSNWLEGVILVCLYIIIAVSFWFYPGSTLPTSVCVP